MPIKIFCLYPFSEHPTEQRVVKMSIASAACGGAGQGSDITQCNSTLNVENSPGGGIRVALSQSEDKT